MSICRAEAAKAVPVGREEVLKQEIGVEVKEKLEQKSCFGVREGLWGKGTGGFLCLFFPAVANCVCDVHRYSLVSSSRTAV